MDLYLPKYILMWVDSRKGELSRQQFIVNCLVKLKEVDNGLDQELDIERWLSEITKR